MPYFSLVGWCRRFEIQLFFDATFGKVEMMQFVGSDRDAALFWLSARHFQCYSIETEVFRVSPSIAGAAISSTYIVARGAGNGLGAAALSVRTGSQFYPNHSLDWQAPCEIHWNHAD